MRVILLPPRCTCPSQWAGLRCMYIRERESRFKITGYASVTGCVSVTGFVSVTDMFQFKYVSDVSVSLNSVTLT